MIIGTPLSGRLSFPDEGSGSKSQYRIDRSALYFELPCKPLVDHVEEVILIHLTLSLFTSVNHTMWVIEQ